MHARSAGLVLGQHNGKWLSTAAATAAKRSHAAVRSGTILTRWRGEGAAGRRMCSHGRSRGRLERLEDEANMRVADPHVQARFLREVGPVSPQIVIQRVESGRFATNEAAFKEYLKAMVSTGQLDQSSISEMMRRYTGKSAMGLSSIASEQAAYAGGRRAYSIEGDHGAGSPWAFSQMGAAGYAGASASQAYGTEMAPLVVQLHDGGVKAQVWKTARIVAFGLAMLVGLNLFMDGKGMPGPMGFASEVKPVMEESGTTFDDVKGATEAKDELQEIVAYLRDSSKFTRLGGKLPKGVLLTGPPGTGKTLLAKAIAGEAGTPFFYASGSEFEEMYVGVGARRVRDLFEAAKKAAPCIVFIDEIDAIGSTRALKEQQALKMTLNQLLVELDGFKETEGIIIVGATNFPEVLDPALVRPGRFDRNVVVPLPDLKDRREILDLYLGKVPIAENVDSNVIARGTPGASGAELANLVNIASLRASTTGADFVTHEDLEYAKDKILMGAERKSAIIPDEVRNVTAYHEGGHALVAIYTNGAMPIHKATIMPRGQALGMVHQLPEESDMLQRTKTQMLAELDVCMGGRVAEELIFGENNVTSGASSDIQKATQIARGMVERYGMGKAGALGVMFAPANGQDKQLISDEMRHKVDEEVRDILTASYERAKKLLHSRKSELRRLAIALMENESLTSDQIKLVIKGKSLPKPEAADQTSKAAKQ